MHYSAPYSASAAQWRMFTIGPAGSARTCTYGGTALAGHLQANIVKKSRAGLHLSKSVRATLCTQCARV